MPEYMSDNNYDPYLIDKQLKSFCCDKEILSCLREINAHCAANHLEMCARLADNSKAMILELKTWILAKTHYKNVFFVPNSWWDHFKKEVFPLWMKSKFKWARPKESIKIEQIIHVCPHANFKFPPGTQPHISWLEGNK